MIAELVAGVSAAAGLGGVITFGIMAYRARGEALRARAAESDADRGRLEAERRADREARHALDAEATSSAKSLELRATSEELSRVRNELAAERMEKGKLYEKLAKLGAPVGDVLVDSALDGLHPNEGDRAAGRDPRSGNG